jgi:hypothetical protein
MMRLDYVRQQRQWQAEQARSAPKLREEDYEETFASTDDADFDMQSLQSSSQVVPREDEVDQVLQMEDEELEALLEHMPTNNCNDMETQSQWSEHFGSDDEDYDVIFSEILGQSSFADRGNLPIASQPMQDVDDMDES